MDEAELLPYRALEVLRRLHDKAGIGIVLAGMPRLLVNLRGKRGEFAQLYSRVGLALPLGDALSRDDFDQIAVSMMPEASDAKISDALYSSARGNARRLGKLLRGVKVVRTIGLARDGINGSFVEIAQEPGIANIKYLTPAL